MKITKNEVTYKTGYKIKLTKSLINSWVMEEYNRELKAFPDWRSICRKAIDSMKNSERRASMSKEQRQNLDKIRWQSRDKEKLRAYQRDYSTKRKLEDPNYRLKKTMRSRFAKFKRGYNLKSIMSLIGCSPQELRAHIESKFKSGMSWDNYGAYWHIDHIIPCKAFDHNDPKQVEQCWHWTNLQPMKAMENMQKGALVKNPQMSLLIGVS
jgi:hypothetical protein